MSQRQIVFYLTPLFLITCIYPDKGVGSTADAVAEDALAVPPIKVKGQVPIESKEKSSFLLSPSKGFGPVDILDSPRTVFTIDKTLIQALGMGLQPFLDPLSVVFYIPSAYSSVNYGLGIAPFSRGYPSTPYINGIEMNIQNGAFQGIPMNWNMIESFDFIEGPAQAIFGATQTSSGVTNYLTKQPYFDSFRGSAQWTTGMYEKYMWLIDLGGPISPNIAYRISYQGMENGNYYQYVHNDQQNLYFNVGFHSPENYQVEFLGDFGTYDYTPLFMWMNRPTENLIENGLYSSGSLSPSLINVGQINNPPYSLYAGPLLPISRRILLQNPEGGARAMLGMLQLIQKFSINDRLKILDNTLVWSNREQLLQPPVYYCLSSRGDYEIGHRTECVANIEFPEANSTFSFTDLMDSGIEWHIQKNLDYVATSFFGANSWDMVSSLPTSWNMISSSFFQKNIMNPHAKFGGLWPIPGAPNGYFFNPLNGSGGSTNSFFFSIAPFIQQTISLNQSWNLSLGLRDTNYFVQAQTPPGTPPMLFKELKTTQSLPLFSISPSSMPFEWMNIYFTYIFEYTTDAAVLGGYSPLFNSQSFHQGDKLYEAGIKLNILNKRLFIDGTIFSQDLWIDNVGLTPTKTTVNGFELDFSYKPHPSLLCRLGYAYQYGMEDWTNVGHGPLETQTYTTSEALLFSLPLNNNAFFPAGVYPFIGWPTNVIDGMINYASSSGLGFTVGLSWFSRQFLGYNYADSIPPEFIIRTRLFYSLPHWQFSLYLFNTTDNKYWLPFGAGIQAARIFDYANIVPGMPFWIQGTLSYLF